MQHCATGPALAKDGPDCARFRNLCRIFGLETACCACACVCVCVCVRVCRSVCLSVCLCVCVIISCEQNISKSYEQILMKLFG